MIHESDVCYTTSMYVTQSWCFPDEIDLCYFRICIIMHNNNLLNKTSMYSRSKFCLQKTPICQFVSRCVYPCICGHWWEASSPWIPVTPSSLTFTPLLYPKRRGYSFTNGQNKKALPKMETFSNGGWKGRKSEVHFHFNCFQFSACKVGDKRTIGML